MFSRQPVEVIGGGLAGLSLALALRREGVDVSVVEAGSYPRHKVCGEFIAGLSQTTVQRLGLKPFLADAPRHREVAWFTGRGGGPFHQRLPSPAIGISRYALDSRLARAFRQAGGTLLERRRAPDTSPRAGRVIACGRRRARSEWIGLKAHLHELPLTADLEIHLGRNAYLGLATVEDGSVNACGLFRRAAIRKRGVALLMEYVRRTGMEDAARRLASARMVPESFCAVAGVEFDPLVPSGTGVRLGDACAMIPPFTGNGMAMAFQSAECALDPILAYARGRLSWKETATAVDAALRRRFRVRLRSAAALHPFLLDVGRQAWLSRLHRARVLPFRLLYALMH